MTGRRRRSMLLLFAIVTSLLALGATGCGGDDDEEEAGATTAATATVEDAGGAVEAAREEIEQFKAIPEFEPPGASFDAREVVQGKTLFSIPATSAVPFVALIQRRMQALAREVGLRFIDWPNQGSPDQWAAGMEQAINRNADLVQLLAGIDPALIAPQIRRADNAGIPTLVSHLYGLEQETFEGVLTANVPYEQAGRLLANQAILDTEGDVNAIAVTVEEVVSSAAMMKGIREVFDERCPDCKLDTIDVSITDLATRIQPQVQSKLNADPGVNYVLALFDAAEVPFVLAGLRAAGATDRVRIATFNGTPEIMKLVQEGDIVTIDVGENLDWIAHALLDQAMRILGDLDPVDNPNIPLRLFDDTNIDEAGTPPAFDKGYGDAYVQGYRELWGLE
jgi:ribose transport system substrate-binding protein